MSPLAQFWDGYARTLAFFVVAVLVRVLGAYSLALALWSCGVLSGAIAVLMLARRRSNHWQ